MPVIGGGRKSIDMGQLKPRDILNLRSIIGDTQNLLGCILEPPTENLMSEFNEIVRRIEGHIPKVCKTLAHCCKDQTLMTWSVEQRRELRRGLWSDVRKLLQNAKEMARKKRIYDVDCLPVQWGQFLDQTNEMIRNAKRDKEAAKAEISTLETMQYTVQLMESNKRFAYGFNDGAFAVPGASMFISPYNSEEDDSEDSEEEEAEEEEEEEEAEEEEEEEEEEPSYEVIVIEDDEEVNAPPPPPKIPLLAAQNPQKKRQAENQAEEDKSRFTAKIRLDDGTYFRFDPTEIMEAVDPVLDANCPIWTRRGAV